MRALLHTHVRGRSSADQALNTFRPLCHVSVMCVCVCVCVCETPCSSCVNCLLRGDERLAWGVSQSADTQQRSPPALFSSPIIADTRYRCLIYIACHIRMCRAFYLSAVFFLLSVCTACFFFSSLLFIYFFFSFFFMAHIHPRANAHTRTVHSSCLM